PDRSQAAPSAAFFLFVARSRPRPVRGPGGARPSAQRLCRPPLHCGAADHPIAQAQQVPRWVRSQPSCSALADSVTGPRSARPPNWRLMKMSRNEKNKARVDIYARITEKIVAQLEEGVRPWVQPWRAGNAAGRITRPLRHNGEPYSGMNVL